MLLALPYLFMSTGSDVVAGGGGVERAPAAPDLPAPDVDAPPEKKSPPAHSRDRSLGSRN